MTGTKSRPDGAALSSPLRALKRPLVLYMLVLFLFMLLLSAMTPLVLDDFTYCFSWYDGSRITRISQIPASMAIHRVHSNGRLAPHSLVTLLMMAPTKFFFNLLNAGNAVLLAFLFRRYFPEHKEGSVLLLLAVGAMIIWNFSPAFGENFLWLDGSINYSWGMSVLLLFLWPYAADYLGIERKKTALRGVLFCVLCFIAGSYSENGSVAMLFAAACLLLLITIRDRKLPLLLTAGLVLAAVGFVWLMKAPATSAKTARLTASVIGGNVVKLISATRQFLLPLYMLYAALLAAGIHLRLDRRRLVFSALLILAGFASIAPFIFAIYFEQRHFCFPVVTAALACLLLLSELMKKGASLFAPLCAGLLAALFAFNLAAGLVDITVAYSKSLERAQIVAQAHEAGERSIAFEDYPRATSYATTFYVCENERDWPNLSMADYYGFDAVYLAGPDA